MWPERKSKDAFFERWLYHRKRTKLFFMCLRQSFDYIGFTIHIQHMSITDLHTQLFTNTRDHKKHLPEPGLPSVPRSNQ